MTKIHSRSSKVKFYLGTSGWSYADWQQAFYPPDLPKHKWLAYYATYFSTVEVNATFYRFFKPQTFIQWRNDVPKGFRFVLKAPRLITHRKNLVGCKKIIKNFCHSAALLEDKLGLILLQLSPHMAYDLKRLEKALLAFDDTKKIAVEFRHDKWLTAETKKLLSDLGCIFCAVDSPQTQLLNWVTTKTAYIRLHGHKTWYDYNYSKKELRGIAHFTQQLQNHGARKMFIFFNNDHHAYAVNNALYLSELLLS